MMDLSVMIRRMMVVIAVMVVIEDRNSEVCISTFIHLFIPALRCSCCE